MRNLIIIWLLVLSSCFFNAKVIRYKAARLPKYVTVSPPENILVMNVFDVSSRQFRKNKETLFMQMLDTMLAITAAGFQRNASARTTVLPGPVNDGGQVDSSVHALMKQHNATHAIVISRLDVYFNQTSVTSDNKEKRAYYDIVADADYALYERDGSLKKIPVSVKQEHSDRKVLSGLLAAGPDIVANSGDALGISKRNARQFIDGFFPVETLRERLIYTTKEFAAVGAAIERYDYETAFTESKKLVDDADKKKAAKANYNCAVLLERNNRLAEAKSYLETSLKLRTLPEAVLMMDDFGLE